MTKKSAMSWIANRSEWQKMYRGTRYRVTAKTLGCEATKKASQPAADQWWENKLAEIHDQQPHREEYEELIETNQKMALWHRQQGNHEAATIRQQEANRLQAVIAGGKEPPMPGPFSDPMKTGVEMTPHIWQERFKQLETQQADGTAVNLSISYHVADWVADRKSDVSQGDLSAKRWERYKTQMRHFEEWIGGDNLIISIDGLKLKQYRSHLIGLIEKKDEWLSDGSPGKKKGISRWEGKQRLETVVQLVRHLWRLDLIGLPKILDDKRFKISVGDSTPKHIPLDHAKLLLAGGPEEASEQTRLYCLLAANCAMRQADIASLTPEMLDWEQGRIKRKRSKTENHQGVPEVDYKLWDCTFDLLKKYGNREGDFVLLNRNNRQLVRHEIRGDKLVETDNIKTAYKQRYINHFDFDYQFGLLRPTSANLLEGHTQFKYFISYFLGHSPQSLKDKHYTVPSKHEFDLAVAWIGEQYDLK